MKKYIVRFETISGDYEKEWCTANSPEEAARTIQDEHWNIQNIVSVSEM